MSKIQNSLYQNLFFTTLLSIFLFLSTIKSQSSKQHLLTKKGKITRLSACMKLSKTRQAQDKVFYNNILSYVKEFSTSQNKIGDFIALTIVVCYRSIEDDVAKALLSTQIEKIDSKNDKLKPLLQLEKYFDLYRAQRVEEVEVDILKMQEQILEVISLSKEAEILQQEYYNIKDAEEEPFLKLPSWNLSEILDFEFSYFGLMYLIVAFIIVWVVISGILRRNKRIKDKEEFTNKKANYQNYKGKKK